MFWQVGKKLVLNSAISMLINKPNIEHFKSLNPVLKPKPKL